MSENSVPDLATNDATIIGAGAGKTLIDTLATAPRTANFPDRDITIAGTDEVLAGGALKLDSAGLGIAPGVGQLTGAALPTPPATNIIPVAHQILTLTARITAGGVGDLLKLRRNGVDIASFDASVAGQALPVSGPTGVGAVNDAYTVVGTGAGAGVVSFTWGQRTP